MPDPQPVVADQMSPAFAAIHRRLGGEVRGPRAPLVWQAFRELTLRPVVPGAAAEGITEGFFMFESSAVEGSRPDLMLSRQAGLADGDGDYVGVVISSCGLFYAPHSSIGALEHAPLMASFPPDRPGAAVDSFLDAFEATERFRVLLRHRPLVDLEISAPPYHGPLGRPP